MNLQQKLKRKIRKLQAINCEQCFNVGLYYHYQFFNTIYIIFSACTCSETPVFWKLEAWTHSHKHVISPDRALDYGGRVVGAFPPDGDCCDFKALCFRGSLRAWVQIPSAVIFVYSRLLQLWLCVFMFMLFVTAAILLSINAIWSENNCLCKMKKFLYISCNYQAFMLLYPWERLFMLIYKARWLLTSSSKLKLDSYNKADGQR